MKRSNTVVVSGPEGEEKESGGKVIIITDKMRQILISGSSVNLK